jgi:hypothetical protein
MATPYLQHVKLAAYQQLGQAFYPHMLWTGSVLVDHHGTHGAIIEDGDLIVYHSNGNRSYYNMDATGEVSCCAFFKAPKEGLLG